MTKPNILCVGHVNLDEILYANNELRQERSCKVESFISAGGGATNTATLLATNNKVGQVYLAGDVGNDERGDKVVNSLNRHGVTLATPQNNDNTTTKIRAVITPDKNPQYMHEDQNLDSFTPEDISDEIWGNIDHVHITSFHSDMAKLFADKAKDEDMTISFNPTQGYFDESFEDTVKLADLIQMNRGESEEFTKRHGSIGAVVNDGKDVVVTHGPAGSTLYSSNEIAHHEGYTVENVFDTVGAGDSFMSGLISSWLNNESKEDNLKMANAYGALSVQVKGAPKYISEDDIKELMD